MNVQSKIESLEQQIVKLKEEQAENDLKYIKEFTDNCLNVYAYSYDDMFILDDIDVINIKENGYIKVSEYVEYKRSLEN